MTAHRYWRWYFTASNGSYYITVGEAELRASYTGPDLTDLTTGTVTDRKSVV